MIDREKVIKGLYAHGYKDCKSCPYWGAVEYGKSLCTQLAKEAFTLLKEPEAVEPISRQISKFNKLLNETIYWCGKCKAPIEKNQSYCGCCGRKVKWDEMGRI